MWGHDVAYCIVQTQSSYWRAIHEEKLVRAYWDALIAAGVDAKTYPFDLCWIRYKFWAAAGWLYVISLLSALKIWDSEENKEKNEYIYMTLADLEIAVMRKHGGVRENHEFAMLKGLALSGATPR